jgi:uncharacterized RDD family membrane protein YckC
MVDSIQSGIVGGPKAPAVAPKGKRFLAALVDLIVIPIILGVVAGLIFMAAPAAVRNIILICMNIAWMVCKDLLWEGAGPGKKMAGLKVVNVETGEKITATQAFIRNVLLIVPFILIIGYIIEIVMIIVKGERFGDQWAKTRVVTA